jgi:outer membrane protein insertion porin family
MGFMRSSSRFLATVAVALGFFASPGWAIEAFRMADIRVDGLQRITAGTVFNYVPVKPGDTVDDGNAPQIIRALYKTGFFKDVRLEREGDVLVILVVERPAISEINISGNKSIETEDLLQGLKDIGLATGRTFNRSVLDGIEQELRRQYFNQGKYGVLLESTVTPLERNRVALDIKIVEGETARIKQINIVGNQRFDEDDLLDEFQLTTGNLLSFWTKDDQYSRQKLAGDLEVLRSFYLDRGYVDFQIESTQVAITPDKKDIYITVNINEGEIHTISDIKLAGDLVLPAEDFYPLIHLRRGEPFSRKQIVESTERVSALLSENGYAFANVNSIPEIDQDNKQVGITFFVDPGKRVYVRRINIAGNSKTRDQVVRREFRQMESAWFSSEKLKLSRERAQRTGFFEDVSVETPAVPGSTDEVDINARVKEKASGSFLAGLGYSQSAGILFNTSISEANFMGTGKRVTLAFNNSSVSRRYQLSYLNPYFTVDGISRGFNLSYQSIDFDEADTADYRTNTGNAAMSFGIPLSEFNSFNFGFGVRHIDFKLGSAPSDEVVDFEDEYGSNFLNFELTASWRHDSRDTAIFPNRGGLQSFSAEATVPGSDLQYYKLEYGHRRYFPIAQNLVFSANGEIAYGDGYSGTADLPIFENFFAGGPSSVRGFKAYSLGPRDSQDDPIGGNFKLVGNLEVLFPPPGFEDNKTVRMAGFFDIGNVFNTETSDFEFDELRYSAGVGASWLSPLGALTFSYAIPLNKKADDETEEFQFNFGTTF